MDLGLTGRTAAIGAGSDGLGFATAAALVGEGVRVAICGRDPGRLAAAAERLGPETVTITADLGDPHAGARFVEEAAAALGPIDILIANAGGPPGGTFATTELDAYCAAFDLNCRSTIAMCQAAIPSMQARGWGRVVAISSIGAKQPIATLMASSVARAALTSFLKITAREVAADGVTVNNLCPGFHRTRRLVDLHSGDGLEALAASVPAQVLGDPGDFGALATFLCSDMARYVTGTSIQVDGGATSALL
jgi:3-oxoacyl-[acyl-carrier protein] reductase